MALESMYVREDEIDDAMDRAAEAIREHEWWIERVELHPEKERDFAIDGGWVCVGSLAGLSDDGGRMSWWVMLNPATGEGRLRKKR